MDTIIISVPYNSILYSSPLPGKFQTVEMNKELNMIARFGNFGWAGGLDHSSR